MKSKVPNPRPLARERSDPDEDTRPLPWFLIMFLGAMAMWGAFYIYTTPSGEESVWGDQRTVASLRPPLPAAGGVVSKIDGKQLFSANCAACHQASGLGLPGVFPPFVGSEWILGSEKTLASILIHGMSGSLTVKGSNYNGAMPAFGETLSDAELAGVMSYIRSEWGNAAPAVTPEAVKAQRDATQERKEPYKGEAELKSIS